MSNQYQPLPGASATLFPETETRQKHPFIEWLEADGDMKDPFYNVLDVLDRYPIENARWEKLIKRIGKLELPIDTEQRQMERAVKIVKSLAEDLELWLIQNPERMNPKNKKHTRDICATINTWYLRARKERGAKAFRYVQ